MNVKSKAKAKAEKNVLRLSDAQVATIFEEFDIPTDEEGRQIAEDLKAAVERLRVFTKNQGELDRLQTVAGDLHRAARHLLAAPHFIKNAFEDSAVAWMIESELVLQVPERWLALNVVEDGVFAKPARHPPFQEVYQSWAVGNFVWNMAESLPIGMDPANGPPPFPAEEVRVCRGSEAVGRLVNELAIGLDRRLAHRKSQPRCAVAMTRG
jgi:hypothetical protein